MNRILALITALTIGYSSSLSAQGEPVKSLEQAKRLCDSALAAAAAGDYTKAQYTFKGYTPHKDDEEFKEYADRVAGQLEAIEERLGSPLGYGFIETVEVGDFIRSYHYALKYSDGIVRWNFVFYKPKGAWLFHYTEMQAIAPIKI
jgi:hypothetical protein